MINLSINARWILLVLLICHSPIKWAAGLILLFITPIFLYKSKLKSAEIITIAAFLLLLTIGTLVNLLNNQNIYGILFGAVLLMPSIFLVIIYSRIARHEDTIKAIKIFTIIQVIAIFLQYSMISLSTGYLNIFSVDKSYGDWLAGTFLSFSTPLAVTFSFISIFFLDLFFKNMEKNHLVFFVLSVFITLLTGAMSVFLSLLPVIAAFSAYKIYISEINKSYKLLVGLFFIIVSAGFFFIQQSNFLYAEHMYTQAKDKALPFKFELALNVLENSTNPESYLFGVGIGNFSSRASLFLSGQYLDNQLFVPVSPSQESRKAILPYFNVRDRGALTNGFDSLSVVSEPFSQYTTLISEYGILGGLIFFSVFIYYLTIARKKKNNLSAYALLSAILFLTNSWLEYPSYSAIFFLFLANEIRYRNEQHA